MINTVFPCLILNVINLLAFALPFSSQIALGITTFLTYSVYSINTSNAIPMQSEILPAITVYYILSSLFTLTSFSWFILDNFFRSRLYLPNALRLHASFMKKIDDLIRDMVQKAKLVPITRVDQTDVK
jgi:hypothetical protein